MRSSNRPITLTDERELGRDRPVPSVLEELVAAVRAVVRRQADWRETARLVADEPRAIYRRGVVVNREVSSIALTARRSS
jgi:hypothetical protein